MQVDTRHLPVLTSPDTRRSSDSGSAPWWEDKHPTLRAHQRASSAAALSPSDVSESSEPEEPPAGDSDLFEEDSILWKHNKEAGRMSQFSN